MKRRIFRLILVAGVLATVHPVQARDTEVSFCPSRQPWKSRTRKKSLTAQ